MKKMKGMRKREKEWEEREEGFEGAGF